MSAGHRHTPDLRHAAQLDALLAEPWFTRCLDRARRDIEVVHDFDMPYVAGSSTDLSEVYVDQHAYLPIVRAGLLPGLIEHELVEGILERHGWQYLKEPEAAHMVASCAEDRVNEARGISRAQADKVYAPLIKADAKEKIKNIPIELNMKPILETGSRALLAHMGAKMSGTEPAEGETLAGGGPHLRKDDVDYRPSFSGSRCGVCRYFEVRGPRQCLKVMGDISPWYWCRLFERG
jgi:hypothetical protein